MATIVCFLAGAVVALFVISLVALLVWLRHKNRLLKRESNVSWQDGTSTLLLLEPAENQTAKSTEREIALQNELDTRDIELRDARLAVSELRQKYNQLVVNVGKDLGNDVTKDATKTENLSDRCRPSVLREQYSQLCFQTASNLKAEISRPENIAPQAWNKFINKLFCALYKNSAEEMSKTHTAVFTQFNNILRTPWIVRSDVVTSRHTHVTESVHGPQQDQKDLQEKLLSYFKFSFTPGQTQPLLEMVTRAALQETEQGSNAHLAIMRQELLDAVATATGPPWAGRWRAFVQAVCDLTWQMTLQRPPMRLETPGVGETVQHDMQNVLSARGLDIMQASLLCVDYYLEPSLLHGSSVLEKGRVMTYLPG